MFVGVLGMKNTTLLGLELKDDAKPVDLRPYPITEGKQKYVQKGSQNNNKIMCVQTCR